MNELSLFTVQAKTAGKWHTFYVEALDRLDALDNDEIIDLLPHLDTAPLIRSYIHGETDCNGITNAGTCNH